MPDDISQAVPEEPIIPEAEAEVQSPEEGSESEQPQTEKPITLADLENWHKKKVEPFVQSQVAKGENRIYAQVNERIKERFGALERERSTLNLSDDQFADAKKKIIEEEQMRAYSPAEAEGDATAQPAIAAFETEFMSGIESIFEEAGVRVMPEDPEWKAVQKEWNNPNGSPAKTYVAISKAAEAKAARLASLKDGAKARVLGGGGPQQTATKPKTAEEKISTGLKATKWQSSEPRRS